MIIFPAIDLKEGKCVRLKQGRADDCKVYSGNPIEMAERWASEGARWLHIVDLDGAFSGHPVHTSLIKRMVSAVEGIYVQVGGGLRTAKDIKLTLDAGVKRAIVGTKVIEDLDSLGSLVEQFGDRLAVGIDARDGIVQGRGWIASSGMKAVELAEHADKAGVGAIIYTDISTDGMLSGPDITGLEQICRAVECSVIASGGISSADDIDRLKETGCSNLAGAIVGKALYEGIVNLDELRE